LQSVLAVGLILLSTVSLPAQPPVTDFDVRVARGNSLPDLGVEIAPPQLQALDALSSEAEGNLNVRWSRLTGAPSRISRQGNALTLPHDAPPRAIANAFLGRYRVLLGLSAEDVKAMRFSRGFKTSHNGVSHLTIQQTGNGIDVFGGAIKIDIDSMGRIIDVSGEPIPNILRSVNAAIPSIDEHHAIAQAAIGMRVDPPQNAKAIGLIYFPVESGIVRLAWRVSFEDSASPDVFDAIVDAVDGALLWWRNLSQRDQLATNGEVYASASPVPNTPKGTSYGAAGDDVPFDGRDFFPNDDSRYDRWAGGARATKTRNDVDTYADRDGDDSANAGSRPTAAGDDFTLAIDPTKQPDAHRDTAVAHLYYWNNRLHDYFVPWASTKHRAASRPTTSCWVATADTQ